MVTPASLPVQACQPLSVAGLAGQAVGALNQPLSDRLHWSGQYRQAGAAGPGRLQPERGLRHVPGRGHHQPVRLGREERQQEAAALTGPQRTRQVAGPLPHTGRLPLLLRRLQGKILVQAAVNSQTDRRTDRQTD